MASMSVSDPELPAQFGKYAVTGMLGQGAMGVVYKGFDAGIGRAVAIKTIRQGPQASTDGAVLAERFVNEARAAGRLSHPGIVSVYELGQQGDLAFIAMEYVEGRDLSQVLAASPALPEPFILKLMVQLLDALDYAHSHGVWHRDIKPANLIVTADGQLKVTDFGIARIESAALTQVTSTIGTPGYMAPEQYVGEKFDHRVDLFAAGVLLYRMLCAKPPFVGTAETVMFHIMNTAPPPLSELLTPERAAFYQPIIDSALAKNPSRRYASAAVFRAALMHRKGQATSPADEATVIVRPTPPPAPATVAAPGYARTEPGLPRTGGSSGAGLPNGWEAEQLAPVQAALSRCMGPLAKVVLRNAAKKCTDLPTLVNLLLRELASEKERSQFLALLHKQERADAGGPDSQFPDSSFGVNSGFGVSSSFGVHSSFGTNYGSAHVELDRLIELASQVLVKHLGPIAKIVIRRAASKARTPEQFMDLLMQELPGEAQKAAFAKEMQTALEALPSASGNSTLG